MMRIIFNESTHLFKLWANLSTGLDLVNGEDHFGATFFSSSIANGNYQSGNVLIEHRLLFAKSNNDGAFDLAVAGNESANVAGLLEVDPTTHDVSSDLGLNSDIHGLVLGSPIELNELSCMNFTTPDVDAAASADACSGFSLAILTAAQT